MTEKELYNSMLPLADVFEQYKNKTINYLSPDIVEIMKSVYLNVQIVYPNVLPRLFQASCGTCIVNSLEQFISIYDRLDVQFKQPQIDKPVTKNKKRNY